MKAKKYALSMIAVYMAYLTHGIQALIFSQNKINFALQWGFDMSDPESAAYKAGVAAVSTAIAWTGFGKFCSVWIGGEISDRVGRKKLMIGGAVLYVICFVTMLIRRLPGWCCYFRFLGCIRLSRCSGSLSCSSRRSPDRYQVLRIPFRYDLSSACSPQHRCRYVEDEHLYSAGNVLRRSCTCLCSSLCL